MRERGIPEGWSAGKASRLGDTNPFPQSPLPGTPDSQRPEPPVPPGSEDQPPAKKQSKWQRWLRNWVFWATLGGLISGGLGFISVALLLRLPSLPNCPSIFWPMASASVRLYCAQVAANKHTVDDLLRAIALVQALPSDHPLHPEIDRYLEEWSVDLLNLGEESFQAGKLQEAIAIARKIPRNIAAYQLVGKQIDSWQSTWSTAEGIYKDTEAEIRQQHWHQAFMIAVQLLNVNNNYWSTTKYEELNNSIEIARIDATSLEKAQSLAKAGGVDNLLAAIKLADSISKTSYIYPDAQEVLPEYGRKLLDLAQAKLDQRDAQGAIEIANQIPASTSLQSEAQDFIIMASALRSAWLGTLPGLEEAIAQAQNISADGSLYNKAQELISSWQLEIEDVTHLDRAREFAQKGTVDDLRAALTEAQLIPDTNPRASEAKQEINRWRGQVETIQDRPYLDQAEQLASSQDINSLKAAINQASQIARGRALYQEAQNKIRNWNLTVQTVEDSPYLNRAEQLANSEDINSLQAAINEASQIANGRALYQKAQRRIWTWTRKIEQIQDQPYLEQARQQAESGNLPAAIATAQQIKPGRALSSVTQATINDWQGQIQARNNWTRARQIAVQGTPDALVEAISLADRVPTTSPLRSDVNDAINQWSNQMLSVALDVGESDIPRGIEIARQIPRGTDAYNAAQQQIGVWQKFLNPNY